jgi:hypothetical protein
VTLEGSKADWEKILSRLDKLPTFGPEPAAWAKLLRPILRRFIGAFDGEPDIDFWGRVCFHQRGGSGPDRLSGWITTFCVWTCEGKWQGPPLNLYSSAVSEDSTVLPWPYGYDPRQKLILDGVLYPAIDRQDVPVGFCEVDVKLIDNGKTFSCMMVSGHVARKIEGDAETLRPFPAWFMFMKDGKHSGERPDSPAGMTREENKSHSGTEKKQSRVGKAWKRMSSRFK